MTPVAVSPPELMMRACAGDGEALRALHRRYAKVVFRHARAAGCDPETASAVVEATFVELCALRRGYVDGADPAPWILAIARRQLDRVAAQRGQR